MAIPLPKQWRITGIPISNRIVIPAEELDFSQIRAQGAGGQHVNKTSSAIHLRFDINRASLPDEVKQRLLTLNDTRINNDGVLVIKSQDSRSAEQNRLTALVRLQNLIQGTLVQRKKRKPTKPTKASQRRRLDTKNQRGRVKQMRGKIRD